MSSEDIAFEQMIKIIVPQPYDFQRPELAKL